MEFMDSLTGKMLCGPVGQLDDGGVYDGGSVAAHGSVENAWSLSRRGGRETLVEPVAATPLPMRMALDGGDTPFRAVSAQDVEDRARLMYVCCVCVDDAGV